MTAATHRLAIRAGAVVLLLALVWVWYTWPSATVGGVTKRLNREVPVGTSRTDAEEWLKREEIEYSYSREFRNDSDLAQNVPDPERYSGYLVAVLRDTDRDLFVTGSIRFIILFDERDRVAKHIVRWFGTGP